jgi:hypothetical protein
MIRKFTANGRKPFHHQTTLCRCQRVMAAEAPIEAGFFITIPVLVVPDGMLWTCVYDDEGNQTVGPVQAQRIPMFVGKECDYGRLLFGYQPFIISHLEIVTFSASLI